MEINKIPEALVVAALVGNHVENERGERLGKIEQVVLDPFSGRIKSVVLASDESGQPSNELATASREFQSLQTGANRAPANRKNVGREEDQRAGEPGSRNEISVYTCPVYRSR